MSHIGLFAGGKKRTFTSLDLDLDNSGPDQSESRDELSVHYLSNLSQVKSDGEKHLKDDFSVIEFWNNRKRQHPNLLAIASRIIATSVSSSASECVSSAIKLLVTDKHSRLSRSFLEHITLIRSLTE